MVREKKKKKKTMFLRGVPFLLRFPRASYSNNAIRPTVLPTLGPLVPPFTVSTTPTTQRAKLVVSSNGLDASQVWEMIVDGPQARVDKAGSLLDGNLAMTGDAWGVMRSAVGYGQMDGGLVSLDGGLLCDNLIRKRRRKMNKHVSLLSLFFFSSSLFFFPSRQQLNFLLFST